MPLLALPLILILTGCNSFPVTSTAPKFVVHGQFCQSGACFDYTISRSSKSAYVNAHSSPLTQDLLSILPNDVAGALSSILKTRKELHVYDPDRPDRALRPNNFVRQVR